VPIRPLEAIREFNALQTTNGANRRLEVVEPQHGIEPSLRRQLLAPTERAAGMSEANPNAVV